MLLGYKTTNKQTKSLMGRASGLLAGHSRGQFAQGTHCPPTSVSPPTAEELQKNYISDGIVSSATMWWWGSCLDCYTCIQTWLSFTTYCVSEVNIWSTWNYDNLKVSMLTLEWQKCGFESCSKHDFLFSNGKLSVCNSVLSDGAPCRFPGMLISHYLTLFLIK